MASKISISGLKPEEPSPNKSELLECTATLEELKTLMEYRGMEAHKLIDDTYAGISGLCQKLGVNPSRGLPKDPNELEMRRKRFGPNKIPMKKAKSIFEFAWEAMKDRTLIVLMISAVITIGISFYHPDSVNKVDQHGWIEGVAIFVSIFIVISFTAINNYTKEQQFCNLKSKIESESEFLILRDGEQSEVLIHDIVVGDILLIKYGNSVPVDGILVQGNELKIDESTLTGECDLIKKSIEADVVLLSGTHLMEGSGRMLVTAVGVNSQTGIIMTLLGATDKKFSKLKKKNKEPIRELTKKESLHQASVRESLSRSAAIQSKRLIEEEAHNERSILRQKLQKLANQIGVGGMLVAVCTFVVLLFRFCIVHYMLGGEAFAWAHVNYFVYYFIIGVTVLVVAVPEGLPLAVALALTYSCKKMMKDNNLVRHMDSCETMGNATSICSDKTGTLTTNRMTVVQSYINGTHYMKTPEFDSLDSNTRTLLMEAISINCSYTTQCFPPESEGEQAVHIGNKTECALLGFVLDLGQKYDLIRRANPEESFFKIYTFNSSRKMMMTVIRLLQANGTLLGYRVFCKGASEIILGKCSYFIGQAGKSETFNDELSKQLLAVIEHMAKSGLRTICVGYKDYIFKSVREPTATEIGIESDNDVDWNNEAKIATNFIGLAICGIQDPVRPEVPEAIKQCQEAGIVVRMVTGDNVNTARSIALSCGILSPDDDYLVLEGRDFNESVRDPFTGEISQDRLDDVWPRLRVLARAQPTDKYALVKGIINSNLSKNREIVAVTGDGTNDGPALKKADIGFAMGIAGTDVAKQACDIILTDDNFSSIVKAVMWGRNIYDTITKFLQFQLTVNFVAIIIVFVSACTIQDSPLKAVQMLWVNLAMDSLGSLALATENPTKDLLKRKPYGRKSSLISPIMARNIIGHGAYMLIVLFTLIFAGPPIFGFEKGWGRPLHAPPTVHFTIIFNTFVLMIQFNEINARKIHDERNGIFNNWIYCVIWISTFVFQVLLVQFGDTIFTTAALNWWQWLVCLAFGLSVLVWHQIVISVPPRIFCQFNVDKDASSKTEHVWTPNPSPPVAGKSTHEYTMPKPING